MLHTELQDSRSSGEDACRFGLYIRFVWSVIIYLNEAGALLDESLQ